MVNKDKKKVSICITYYNTKPQLLNTLWSIESHNNDRELFDIIIVDDVSESSHSLTEEDFKPFNMDIKLISTPPYIALK